MSTLQDRLECKINRNWYFVKKIIDTIDMKLNQHKTPNGGTDTVNVDDTEIWNSHTSSVESGS